MGELTKTPWKAGKAEQKKNFVQIPIEQGMAVVCYVVGSTNPMLDWYQGATHADANTHQIVKAVNFHDRMLKALRNSLAAMESDLVRIEGEWGMGKSLSRLEEDGELTDEIIEVRALLAELDR